MEVPMSIINTVWEPHTFAPPYDKPVTIPSKPMHVPHPEFHLQHITHSIQSHLPWHHPEGGHVFPQTCPETDIFETAAAYHVEMALAGVSDMQSVEIRWPGPRTLVVQGVWKSAEGVEVAGGRPALAEVELDGGLWKKGAVGGKTDNEHGVEGAEHGEPLYILQERGVGVFQRTFELPVDVDVKECRAGLEHGLLRIDVPKIQVQEKPTERVMLDDT